MAKYRKIPVVIDAICWNGKLETAQEFMGDAVVAGNRIWIMSSPPCQDLYLWTFEGEMRCSVGDYIIKGVKGEFYPCKSDIFEQTYEAVEQDSKAQIRCEGSCEEHRGIVRRVIVHGSRHAMPFFFNYCDAAIEEDVSRGFMVREDKEELPEFETDKAPTGTDRIAAEHYLLSQATVESLRKAAARENWNSDPEFNAYEFSAGNYDDAYSGGYEDGYAQSARDVLNSIVFAGQHAASPAAEESSK